MSWVFSRLASLDQGRCPLDPCELLKKLDQNFCTCDNSRTLPDLAVQPCDTIGHTSGCNPNPLTTVAAK